jgi:hypothetical protein
MAHKSDLPPSFLPVSDKNEAGVEIKENEDAVGKSFFEIVRENPSEIIETKIHEWIDKFVKDYSSADDMSKAKLWIDTVDGFTEPWNEFVKDAMSKKDEGKAQETKKFYDGLVLANKLIVPYIKSKYSKEVKTSAKNQSELFRRYRFMTEEEREEERIADLKRELNELKESYYALGGKEEYGFDDTSIYEKSNWDKILNVAITLQSVKNTDAFQMLYHFVADRRNNLIGVQGLI